MRVASRFYIDSDKVRDWLKKQGHSEGWLSDELGVHYNTVRNMLAHKVTPVSGTIRRLAELMRVKPESILVVRS